MLIQVTRDWIVRSQHRNSQSNKLNKEVVFNKLSQALIQAVILMFNKSRRIQVHRIDQDRQ
jgi:hypothetical protein